MSSPPFSAAYIIFDMDENGLPTRIIPYYTNTATYISAAITLCLAWTKTRAGREPFIGLAKTILPQSSGSWRKDLTDEQTVGIYIDVITAKFVLVMIARHLKNENFYACTHRRWGSKDGRTFDPHNHSIIINGVRTEKMARAGVRAVSSGDPNSKDSKRFQTFVFTLAKSIYHELGHLFVTFLGGGAIDTPPHIKVPESGAPPNPYGESGQVVEKGLWGGLIYLFKDGKDDDDQAGKVYLRTTRGDHEITHKTIKKYVGFDLTFPIPEADLGDRLAPGTRSLGEGQDPPEGIRDPMNMIQVQTILSVYKTNAPKWDQAVNQLLEKNPNPPEMTAEMLALLKQVPWNPALCLADEPKGKAVAVK